MDAKTAILARARDAISHSQRSPMRPVPRDYIRTGQNNPGSTAVVADMVDKLEDYSAAVVQAPADTKVLDDIRWVRGASGSAACSKSRR